MISTKESHIRIIKNGKCIKLFTVSLRNRLVIGDVLNIHHLIFGECSYHEKIYSKYTNDMRKKDRQECINELRKFGIHIKHNVEVRKIFIAPIGTGAPEFVADVSVVFDLLDK